MKKDLTIITRLTERERDDEYELVWSAIYRHVKQSKFGSIRVSTKPAMTLITTDTHSLLIISGTNFVTNPYDNQRTTANLITRFTSALRDFKLSSEVQNILFHNSQFLDANLLTTYFTSQNHTSLGYHLGNQNNEPVYERLLKPLIETLNQYLTDGSQSELVKTKFETAIEYIQAKGKSLSLLFPIQHLQSFFTDEVWRDYLFIGNPENFDVDSKAITKITSAEELQLLIDAKQKPPISTLMVVLCELNWIWQSLENKSALFKGIEIVKQLRRNISLQNPVLFISAAPQGDVFNFADSILFAVGHHFVSLHKVNGQLSQKQRIGTALKHPRLARKGLTKLELIDVQEHYCDTNGGKRLLLHRLKSFELILSNSELTGNEKQLDDLKFKWSEQYEHACRQFDLLPDNLSSQTTPLPDTVRDCIAKLESQSLLNGPQKTGHEVNHNSLSPWTVLVLDDERDDRYKQLEAELTRNKQCQVLFFQTAEAVLHHLNDPQTNKDARLLIADYRLEEPDGLLPEHQPLQGYDVLAEVATRKDLAIALVAFSAMPRKFLMNTFNQFGIKVEIFSKIDYFKNNTSISDFACRLIQLGDDCEESLADMPKSSNWPTLKPAYMAYRKSVEQGRIEEEITQGTLELIKLYEAGKLLQLKVCSNVTPKFTKEFPQKEQQRFIEIFCARRLAAYLFLTNQEQDILKIACFLLCKDADFKIESARVFFSTVLALRLEDLPFGLTMEESRFLYYQFGLPITPLMRYIKPLFRSFEHHTSSLLNSYTTTLRELSDED